MDGARCEKTSSSLGDPSHLAYGLALCGHLLSPSTHKPNLQQDRCGSIQELILIWKIIQKKKSVPYKLRMLSQLTDTEEEGRNTVERA